MYWLFLLNHKKMFASNFSIRRRKAFMVMKRCDLEITEVWITLWYPCVILILPFLALSISRFKILFFLCNILPYSSFLSFFTGSLSVNTALLDLPLCLCLCCLPLYPRTCVLSNIFLLFLRFSLGFYFSLSVFSASLYSKECVHF